ncbi:hypothetical protein [Streptomyces sp. NPDC048392]|uniref:hypothetical protein n=1 Tax=Streptomyces sp. NPDC048392 TaxID=3365543 RepID=UPI003719DE22
MTIALERPVGTTDPAALVGPEVTERLARRITIDHTVYGAVWFTDPAVLLPAIRERLRPGGRLVFSQRPPVEGCYGCQASYIPRGADEDPLVVKRWDYEPDAWERLLKEHGFTDVDATVLAAPPGNRTIGTLIVRARA